MVLNLKAVIKNTGIILVITGLSMIPSMIVALIYHETGSFFALLFSAAVSTAVGVLMHLATGKAPFSNQSLKMRDGFLIVTLSWVFASVLGALPFIFSGSISDPVNAFFESCSGFSTTGSTILKDIEVLPKSILFWRSFTHWLGGMGIVVLAIALLPALGLSGQTAVRAEVPGMTLDKLTPKMADTAKALYVVYLSLTLIETVLLMLGGMSLYDALIHTLGSVGTGGFSNYNDSVAHFGSTYINIVITVFMLLSASSFSLFYTAFSIRKPVLIVKDNELRFYIFIFVFFSVLITADTLIYTDTELSKAISDGTFQTASILTTTGFSTADYCEWSNFCQLLIFLLFFIGGCSGSTGGGIKVIRILVILKCVRRGIAQRLHPHVVKDIEVNGKQVQPATISGIMTHLFLFSVVTAFGTLLVTFDNYDIITSLSAVLSCIGNVGPGFGLVGPASNFELFSGFSKIVLSFLMIAGRLELITFFVLFSPKFWNPNR